jgi:hypothetical protein
MGIFPTAADYQDQFDYYTVMANDLGTQVDHTIWTTRGDDLSA